MIKKRKSSQKLSVKHINYGIACRIGNIIYINKRLKDFSPNLYNAILSHEKAHTAGFSWEDVALDIQNKHIENYKREYYQFILANPLSWTEFLPVWKYNGEVVLSPLIAVLWTILAGGFIWLIAML